MRTYMAKNNILLYTTAICGVRGNKGGRKTVVQEIAKEMG